MILFWVVYWIEFQKLDLSFATPVKLPICRLCHFAFQASISEERCPLLTDSPNQIQKTPKHNKKPVLRYPHPSHFQDLNLVFTPSCSRPTDTASLDSGTLVKFLILSAISAVSSIQEQFNTIPISFTIHLILSNIRVILNKKIQSETFASSWYRGSAQRFLSDFYKMLQRNWRLSESFQMIYLYFQLIIWCGKMFMSYRKLGFEGFFCFQSPDKYFYGMSKEHFSIGRKIRLQNFCRRNPCSPVLFHLSWCSFVCDQI